MTTLTGEGWLNRPVGVPVPSARLWAEIRVPIPDVAVRPLMAEHCPPWEAATSPPTLGVRCPAMSSSA